MPAPSRSATRFGTTRASAKVPAPAAPRALATTTAASAAAPVDTKLVSIVMETLRKSIGRRLLLRPRPADDRLAGVAFGPGVVERAVQIVRRPYPEGRRAEHRREQG